MISLSAHTSMYKLNRAATPSAEAQMLLFHIEEVPTPLTEAARESQDHSPGGGAMPDG